jgi:hypothetical protein
MTTLPLRAAKLLPDRDAMIGCGVGSGMREPDFRLTLIVDCGLVRVQSARLKVAGGVLLIPREHFAFLEPKGEEPAATLPKK